MDASGRQLALAEEDVCFWIDLGVIAAVVEEAQGRAKIPAEARKRRLVVHLVDHDRSILEWLDLFIAKRGLDEGEP